MTLADDYFARVRPLLGAGLSKCIVEVDDAELAGLVLELLASCMLERVIVTRPETLPALERAQMWKRPWASKMVRPITGQRQLSPSGNTSHQLHDARIGPASMSGVPDNKNSSEQIFDTGATENSSEQIFDTGAAETSSEQIFDTGAAENSSEQIFDTGAAENSSERFFDVCLSGVPDARIVARRGPTSVTWRQGIVSMTVDPDDVLAYVDASYHVARILRDILLGRIAWPSPSAATTSLPGRIAWPSPSAATTSGKPEGVRLPKQPFDPRGISLRHLRDRHVMVIGCGSLGSEAVRMLAPSGARFTLVDDAQVTIYNLARQWYGAEDVGRPKVDALVDRLDRTSSARESSTHRPWRTRLEASELPAFEQLLRDDPPDVVLLATGTHHHAMLAELLWRLGIPHVAACCYPRAQYFEVSIVSPRESTPCLHCYRGHLYAGPPAPVPDEVAAFLYEPVSDAERARRYTDLVAEPASQIETMRAAHVLARCAVELVAPVRTQWFAQAIDESTTCLLGGNSAGAYGITTPGQVLRLGPDDVADAVHCSVCERQFGAAFETGVPEIPDDADAVFTA